MSVTLHTTLGDLKLELNCDQCPKACEVSSHINIQISYTLNLF